MIPTLCASPETGATGRISNLFEIYLEKKEHLEKIFRFTSICWSRNNCLSARTEIPPVIARVVHLVDVIERVKPVVMKGARNARARQPKDLQSQASEEAAEALKFDRYCPMHA